MGKRGADGCRQWIGVSFLDGSRVGSGILI